MDRAARAKIGYRGIINGKCYSWPDPFRSDTDFNRFTGADIDELTELDKWKELKKLESIIPWLDDKAILIVDLTCCPARVITKQAWGIERLKKLKQGAA
jgi:hypothetical protein